jgi:predicted metal-binding protein
MLLQTAFELHNLMNMAGTRDCRPLREGVSTVGTRNKPMKQMIQCSSKNEEKVLSLEDCQKEREILWTIQPLGKKHGIDEILPVNVKDICVANWVQMKCKYGCKKFGKSWCCPPETPTPDQVRSLLNEYKKALLLCGRITSSEFHKDNYQKRRKQVQIWKGTVALERQLFLAGYYKAFALVSESCALCRECTYPHDCKFPMDRRPSVESFSIDVFKTLQNIGKQFEIAKDIMKEHNCYSLILLE